jgi:hypothetical protein
VADGVAIITVTDPGSETVKGKSLTVVVTVGSGAEPVPATIFSSDVTATAKKSISALSTVEITTEANTTGGKIFAVNNFTSDSKPEGEAKDMITNTANAYGYCITNNTTYFKIVLDKALQAGDVITSKGVINKDTEVGLWVTTEETRPSSCIAALTVAKGTAAWTTLSSYTIKEDDGLAGQTTIYIHRVAAKSTYFDEFTITRPAATGVKEVKSAGANAALKAGKYVKNGKLVIVRDGKQYNVNGVEIR